MRADIVPGATFPDYELPDHEGVVRSLSELQGGDPMILVLARGQYSPKEHQQHLDLVANWPKISVARGLWSTASTTVTGSGEGRRSPSSAGICVKLLARSGRTSTSALLGCERPGMQETSHCSTVGRELGRRADVVVYAGRGELAALAADVDHDPGLGR